ncbi:MAG: DUF58 domain-containing protein [Inquilinus sp.]|nr:DUF58 domain-containing protein [Inquilinus sp.]
MMRPTARAALLFGAGVPMSLAAGLAAEPLWPFGLVYLGIALLLTGLDAILIPARRRLRVDAKIPDILYVGDRDALALTLAFDDARSAASLDLACDTGPLLEPPPRQTIRLSAGRIAELTIPLVPRRRGTAAIERLWLRWRGPLGLMAQQRIDPLDAGVPVVPNVRAVRSAAARLNTRDAPFGSKVQKQQGDGSEFDALRDYVPGLDRRSIDWKHSARHRSLLCKEFRTERNHQIVLAIDTGHLMSEPLAGVPKLDHAINAGLMLTYMSLRAGDRVGLFGFDSAVRHASAPVGGLHNFWRLQQASAGLDYRADETNFTLCLADLLGRLNRRSLVVLLTDFVDTTTAELMVENLQRLSRKHLVLFVALRDGDLHATVEATPESFGDVARAVIADDFLRERAVVLERLHRLGIHSIEAPSGRISMELVNRYLLIKRQDLI